VIGDNFVQQLGDASVGAARRFFEAGFHGGRDAPRIYFALPGHALQCNAIPKADQSSVLRHDDGAPI
jgi:hypothetical protein